jgi:hypothetical protein
MTKATAQIVVGCPGGTVSSPIADSEVNANFKTYGQAMTALLASAGWARETSYGTQVDFSTQTPAYVNPGGNANATDYTFGYQLYKFTDAEQTASDGLPVHVRLDFMMRRHCNNYTNLSYSFAVRAFWYIGLDLTVPNFRGHAGEAASAVPIYTYSIYATADQMARTHYATASAGYYALVHGTPFKLYSSNVNETYGCAGFFAMERPRDATTGATHKGTNAGLIILNACYNNGGTYYTNGGVLRPHTTSHYRTGSFTSLPRGGPGNVNPTMSYQTGGDIYVWPTLPTVRSICYMPSVVGYSDTDLPAFVPVSIPTRTGGSLNYLPLGTASGPNANASPDSDNAAAGACHAIRWD